MTELEFWEESIENNPIIVQMEEKWMQIRDEIVELEKNYPQWFTNYPKFKITDSATGEKVKMYDNEWKITALSTLTEEYQVENYKAEKVGKSSLEKLVKRYRSKILPTLDSIINDSESSGILANVFVSVLYPGTIIRPHQGYSQDYMRIHLGLICDPECKITVGDKTKTWKEGKILAFKDGGPYYHSVKHQGTKNRYILSFDLKLNYLMDYIKL